MHMINVKMGVVVFNRQFVIYLDGPSKDISLNISRHTLLTQNVITVIMNVQYKRTDALSLWPQQ